MLTIKSLASIPPPTIGPLYPFHLPPPPLLCQPSEALLTDTSCLRSSSLPHLCPSFTQIDRHTDRYIHTEAHKHRNAEIHTDTQRYTDQLTKHHTQASQHIDTHKHTQTTQTRARLTRYLNEKAYILNVDLPGFKTGLTRRTRHSHPLSVMSLALSNF